MAFEVSLSLGRTLKGGPGPVAGANPMSPPDDPQSAKTEQDIEPDKFRVVIGLLLIGFAFAAGAVGLTIGRL